MHIFNPFQHESILDWETILKLEAFNSLEKKQICIEMKHAALKSVVLNTSFLVNM